MKKIVIDGELTDLNKFIQSLKTNRWKGQSVKNDETERVAWDCKIQNIKPVLDYPIKIKYCWYSKDKRMDIDNVAFAKKFINDGLKMAGVIIDDSRKFIAGFSDDFFIDKNRPRVEVFIESV